MRQCGHYLHFSRCGATINIPYIIPTRNSIRQDHYHYKTNVFNQALRVDLARPYFKQNDAQYDFINLTQI